MSIVGKSEVRVDAFDKATGRTKYYEDRMPAGALYARIKHSEIAHGYVKSIDTSAAEAIEGVVKVLTCFDVPDIAFPTAGHPWSMDPGHQDVADRHLLNRHVRYYGDEVAVVIAENEVAAMQGVRALKVEYDVLPFVLDVQKAMEPDAPQIHEECPGNVLKHTSMAKGNYDEAIQEPGLIKVEGWYETPMVQHCHIENHGCYAYGENGRITVVSSTQIPHIIRRIVGQALGRPWADIQIIKPGDHDRWTNTIMDIIPVSTKVLGILGEGITHTLTGVYFMMTGVDVDGVQTYEFGSSEGNLKEKLFLDKAGTPGTNDVIISFDFLFKSHQGQERGACTRAHQACDKFMQTYRDKMKKFKGDLCTHRSTYYDTVRPGAKRVVIIKQVAGQGAMYDTHLFGKEPSSSEGGKSIIDMGNMPVIVTPNEYRDGIIRSMQ